MKNYLDSEQTYYINDIDELKRKLSKNSDGFYILPNGVELSLSLAKDVSLRLGCPIQIAADCRQAVVLATEMVAVKDSPESVASFTLGDESERIYLESLVIKEKEIILGGLCCYGDTDGKKMKSIRRKLAVAHQREYSDESGGSIFRVDNNVK